MNAIVLHSHKSLISFSFSKQIRMGNPICPLNDGRFAVTSHKDVLKLGVSSTNSDGGRPLHPGRTEMEDESETPVSSDDKLLKSAKQERIIALFRQIQSSISKAEEAKQAKQITDNLSENSPTESVPKVLHQSQKAVKARVSDMKLPQLKDLAKSRGIKGYSKLKKSEFLELLSS